MFYFISTLGIAVIINNEIFNNDPNGTPSMSLSNRTGTHIDAGSYTCYFDNSLLNSTNDTRFNMEANRHYLIVVCYLSDTFLLLCLLHVLNLVCFLFFPDRKNKTTPLQMQKRNESSFGFPKCIMYIPSPRFLCRLTAYMDLL